MRGRNPSAAPGLEDGRGRAAIGTSLFVSAELSIFELSCDKSSWEARPGVTVPHDASANSKPGKSANTQSFFSVL
jgi:hypothetical protein